MMSLKHSYLAFALSLTGAAAYGQATLNAAGGTVTASGNVHEWSVGEMALVQTFSTPNLVVTQGVLQPSTSGTGGVSTPGLTGLLDVYPNPATDRLLLKHNFGKAGRLDCQLLDALGKTVAHRTYVLETGTGTEALSLPPLAAGYYLLQVRFEDRSDAASTAAFPIQKIN